MDFKSINIRNKTVKVVKLDNTIWICQLKDNSSAFRYAKQLKFLPECHVHSNKRGDNRIWKQIN